MTPRLIPLGLVLLLGCKPADLGQQFLQETASGDGVTLVFFDRKATLHSWMPGAGTTSFRCCADTAWSR
jgi:hypothetical protein